MQLLNEYQFSDGVSNGESEAVRPLTEIILDELCDGAKIRDQLVRSLKMPRTTIYIALKKLIDAGKVTDIPIFHKKKTRGRPKIAFMIK